MEKNEKRAAGQAVLARGTKQIAQFSLAQPAQHLFVKEIRCAVRRDGMNLILALKAHRYRMGAFSQTEGGLDGHAIGKIPGVDLILKTVDDLIRPLQMAGAANANLNGNHGAHPLPSVGGRAARNYACELKIL